MVTGKPLAKRVMPETDQPWASCRPIRRGTQELFEGQFVFVAEDEVVFDVERRERITERGVEGIDFLADVRRLIQRLAEGVGRGDFQTAAGVAGAQLERVVVGMADVRLQRVAAEVCSQRSARSVHLTAGNGIVDSVFAAGAAGERAGLTSLGWLRLRHSAGLPGLGSTNTRWRWLAVPT